MKTETLAKLQPLLEERRKLLRLAAEVEQGIERELLADPADDARELLNQLRIRAAQNGSQPVSRLGLFRLVISLYVCAFVAALMPEPLRVIRVIVMALSFAGAAIAIVAMRHEKRSASSFAVRNRK